MAAAGRLFRYDGTSWRAIDEPLPAWQHATPTPELPVATWVLPRAVGARSGDVVSWGEQAHRLLAPVPPGDEQWRIVHDEAAVFVEAEDVEAWLATIELWLGAKLAAGADWPLPPDVS